MSFRIWVTSAIPPQSTDPQPDRQKERFQTRDCRPPERASCPVALTRTPVACTASGGGHPPRPRRKGAWPGRLPGPPRWRLPRGLGLRRGLPSGTGRPLLPAFSTRGECVPIPGKKVEPGGPVVPEHEPVSRRKVVPQMLPDEWGQSTERAARRPVARSRLGPGQVAVAADRQGKQVLQDQALRPEQNVRDGQSAAPVGEDEIDGLLVGATGVLR